MEYFAEISKISFLKIILKVKELINFIFFNQCPATQKNVKKKFNCHINLSRQRIFNDILYSIF